MRSVLGRIMVGHLTIALLLPVHDVMCRVVDGDVDRGDGHRFDVGAQTVVVNGEAGGKVDGRVVVVHLKLEVPGACEATGLQAAVVVSHAALFWRSAMARARSFVMRSAVSSGKAMASRA